MVINIVRSIIFLLGLGLLWLGERWRPRVPPKKSLGPNRQLSNIALGAFNIIVINLLFVGGLYGLAGLIQRRSFGLFNVLNFWVICNIILGFIVLDMLVYFQHWLFHRVNILWRLHRVHHLDNYLDFTTGIRFHPLEIVLSFLLKASVVVAFGIHPLGMVIFEIVLSMSSLFTHTNIFISPKFDRLIRFFIVSPDMHRIHHSLIAEEMNSNFGFNFSLWDRIFKTYRPAPKIDYAIMPVGLPGQINQEKNKGFISLLVSPFS